LVLLSLWCLDV